MGLLERICEPCRQNTCKRLFDRHRKMQQFASEAQGAASVYDDAPGGSLREATDAELADLGLSRDFLEVLNDKDGDRTDFRAKMYVDKKTGARMIAFRGTTSKQDWGQNARQGVGVQSAYYTRAQQIAARVSASPKGNDIKFVGHSLGGGLASAASRASGNPATTFNAAGLNPLTVLRGDKWKFDSPIEAVRVRGEILTSIQEDSAISLFAPDAAYSERFDIDPARGFGAQQLRRVFNGQIVDAAKARLMRSVDLHGMDSVQASLKQDMNDTVQALIDNGC